MPCAKPTVEHFFHEETYTLTFVVYDAETKDAVILDSVMDLDTTNWQVSQKHNDKVLAFVHEHGLKVHYVLDTHVHADHITGAARLCAELKVPYGIGKNITQVQKTFAGLFNLPDFKCDGSQFGLLIADNDKIEAGSLLITAWNTPGHTPACLTYLIGDAVFTGDVIFTEDFGCGRCDFPGGSAGELFDSVMRLYNLPDETRVFVGHDYQPGGRPLRWESTIKLEKEKQEDLPASASNMRDEFVKGKNGYDKTLNLPRLIFPSLLVNMNAGVLPPAAANGMRYFMMPMNTRQPVDELGRAL